MTSIVPKSTHHVAISVIDLAETIAFYKNLGFRLALQWTSGDDTLRIAHMEGPGGTYLELFAYEANQGSERLVMDVGNDLTSVGLKHFGLAVDNLSEAHAALSKLPGVEVTDIKKGRMLIDYFFVRDPNGIWVEVVEDHRSISAEEPIYLTE
jgi:catechol 2,3-dioxygenase-like lactoylglutathione lyase family enzyme